MHNTTSADVSWGYKLTLLDKYFNTQAMVNPKTPEEVKLVLEEVLSVQKDILERFLEIKRKLDETSKGNENE